MLRKKDYTPVQLQNSIADVNRKRNSISMASNEYGIPRQTLSDHFKGQVQHYRPKPPATFDEVEEEALASYCAESFFQIR